MCRADVQKTSRLHPCNAAASSAYAGFGRAAQITRSWQSNRFPTWSGCLAMPEITMHCRVAGSNSAQVHQTAEK
jgi:hypothetical protein